MAAISWGRALLYAAYGLQKQFGASATKSDLEDSPNGSKEKGKEGRKEKEVTLLEASSREPSIERSSPVGGLFYCYEA